MAYYKRPEFNKRLADTIAANARLARQDAMTQARAAEQQRARAKQMMDQAEQMHSEIDVTASGVEHSAMQQDYLANYSRARIAGYNADQMVKQAQDAEARYNKSLDRYNNFIETQQKEYNRWRQNIRQPHIVHAEIDSVSKELEKLTSRRSGLQNINLRMAGNTGYAGSVAIWNDTANTQKQIDDNMAQLKQLNTRIAQLTKSKNLLQEEAEWGEYFRYADLSEAPDFAEKSQYVTTANGEKTRLSMDGRTVLESGFDDYIYDFINKNEAAADVQSLNASDGWDWEYMKQMNDEEIATFNYLYATQGKEPAYEYITYLTKELNYRQRKEDEKYWKQFASENPVGASVFSIATSPLKGISYAGQAVDYAVTGEIDQNANYNRYSYINNDIRGQVAEKIQKSGKWGNVGSFAYMTGMSMADFLLNTAIGGGNRSLPLAIMGSGAAADTTIQAKERGLDSKQAFTLGTIAGLAEIITEKVSIDSLLDADMLKDGALKYIGKNMLAEGSEEVASDIINLYADILVSQDKSEWYQSIEAYEKQGKSRNEAFGLAVRDQAISMGVDFFGGAISGSLMSSVNAGRHKLFDSKPRSLEQIKQDAENSMNPLETKVMPTIDDEAKLRKIQSSKTTAEATGYLYDVKEDIIQQVNRLSKVIGKEINFYQADATEAGMENGFYDSNMDIIYINANSQNPTAQIIGHELTHSTEIADVYDSLSNLVMDRIQRTEGDLEAMRKETARLYDANGHKLNAAEVDQEIVAQYVEKHLLTDEKAIMEMANRNRTVVQTIKEWFDRLLARLGNGKAQEREFITNARDIYAKALQQADSMRQEASLEQDKQNAYAEGNEAYGDALFDSQWNQPGYVEGLLDTEFRTQNPADKNVLDSTAVERNTGEIQYSYSGINKDGIEVYETSENIKNLPYKDRVNYFKDIMEHQYRGRTAKLYRNGHAYYAQFDSGDVNKNIYGDKRSDKKGWKAKINVGADGDIFELVENAQYNGSRPEQGKKIAAHKGVGYWDYFIKTVQIDDLVYDLVANVRKKQDNSFVYSIQLNENKKIVASPSLGLRSKPLNRMLNATDESVAQDSSDVKPKFSISRTTDNKPFVEVEQDILAGVPEKDWVSTVKQNLKDKFPDGIVVGRNKILINSQSRDEMTYSKYMQRLYNNNKQIHADKLRATNNSNEILQTATGWINEVPKHLRKDNIVDFARGNVLLRVGQNDYKADVVVGMRKNGTMVMYDVLKLTPTAFTKKETDAAIGMNPSPGATRGAASVSDESISEKNIPVKPKFSISKTEDNRPVAVVDNDILAEIDTSTWNTETKKKAKQIASRILQGKEGHLVIDGIDYQINRTTRREYTRSKDTERLYRTNKDAFADKLRAASNVEDIIASTHQRDSDGGLKHPRDDGFIDFLHGDVLIQAGNNQYVANTVIGVTDKGERILYDVVGLEPTKFKIKKESPSATIGNSAAGVILGDSSSNSIVDKTRPVKSKSSISPVEETDFDDALRENGLKVEPNTRRGIQYSISEIKGEKQDYGKGVILDTDIFDGVKPRYWWRVLDGYIQKNLAGKKVTVYDKNGKPEVVQFANINDRVKKDGSNNSHKVLGELSKARGNNIQTLATAHFDELLETSRYKNSTDGHTHQWMDENGWEHHRVYVQDIKGNIYEATINIANGKDRKIVYGISNVRKIDINKESPVGTVLSTQKGRGLPASHDSSSVSIKDAGGSVKPKFSVSPMEETDFCNILQTKTESIIANGLTHSWIEENPKTVKAILGKKEQVNTEAFQKWFGKSKVLTPGNDPAVVFHGAKERFYTFDTNGKPMWLAVHPWYSMHYAKNQEYFDKMMPRSNIYAGGRQQVIPAYVRAEFPLELGSTDEKFKESAEVLARRSGIPEPEFWEVWNKVGQPEQVWEVINTAEMVKLARKYGYDSLHAIEYGNPTWAVFNSNQIKSAVANKGTFDQDKSDIRYSISEQNEDEHNPKEIELPKVDDGAIDLSKKLPVKAADYVARTQRTLLVKISDTMSVPHKAGKEKLMPVIRKITNEYLRSGTISDEVRNDLFEEAYAAGVEVDTEFYDQYKEVKDHLRTTAVTLSEQDQGDIADYKDFRKRTFGTLKIVNAGGIPVDSFWDHLHDMAPNLFPESVTHPADQLQHMYEVGRSIQKTERTLDEYYGPDAEMYKKFARNEFDAALSDAIINMRDVARYMDSRIKLDKVEPEMTQEEVTALYPILKETRRTYEKVSAKNLLTEEDQKQVSRLLCGDIRPEHLNQEKDNVKGILAVYEAKAEYEKVAKQIRSWNRAQKAKRMAEADQITKTANLWKDKSTGIQYQRETMERNVQDIIQDKAVAKKVIDTYFKPVHEAQAAATRMKNRYRSQIQELNISRKVAAGNKVSEAYAVQLIGEAADNIQMMQNSKGRMKYRDGKTLDDWKSAVQDLWKENPDLDKEKIYDAVDQFRKIYDELFQQMNEVRIRNGYEPVNYRHGYFPHFQAEGRDGVMALFGKALGIDTEVTALPTTINGLTHTFKPGIRWFGNALERTGFETTYDAVEGFDKYIEGVADVIHHTDNIQKLRALASQIRYRTSEPGIQKQVDEVRAREDLSDTDKELRIKEIYEKGKFELSNFVVELDEYTNLLANKKSRDDRNMEQKIGRNAYNVVKALESRVAANMVAVNPASWLTNFVPLTQGWAALDTKHLMNGMLDTLKAYKADDGMVDMSSFLTNRRGSDPLVKTWQQGTSAALSKPMDWIDNFTSDTLIRARYQQNIDRGLSETESISEADSWAAGVMADRSKGSMPTLFEHRNPLAKLFTQFQLEVNNQLSYVFKDVPREMKDKGLAALAMALLKFAVGAWLYDELYEYIIGRRPALDPIGILNDTIGDATGYKMPNLVELGVGAVKGELPSFQTEKKRPDETIENFGKNVLEELPFIGGLMGGGRLPINSAIPNVGKLIEAAGNTEWSAKKKFATAAKELSKPATYLVPPFGGGQLKKIYDGLKATIKKGSYTLDAEGNEQLQYPVYAGNAFQFAKSFTQAVTFGKTSLKPGRDWIEGGFGAFTAEQTACYKAMMEVGVSGEDSFGLIKSLREAAKTEEHSKDQVMRDILQKSEVSGAGKAVAYYGLLAKDKERTLMEQLDNTDTDPEVEVNLLIDFKNAKSIIGADGKTEKSDSTVKRDILRNSNISGEAKKVMYREILAEEADSKILDELGNYSDAVIDTIMDIKDTEGTANKLRIIADENLSDRETEALAGMVMGSNLETEKGNPTQYANFLTASKKGISYDDALRMQADGIDLGDFVELRESGVEAQDAKKYLEAVDDLEPMEGKEKVVNVQKWRTAIDTAVTTTGQLNLLAAVMEESTYEKVKIGYDLGVEPAAYVRVKEVLPQFDANGNGSYSNDEITAAIRSITSSGIMLPGGDKTRFTLSSEQQGILWQMFSSSKSVKNNPFNGAAGQRYLDARNGG